MESTHPHPPSFTTGHPRPRRQAEVWRQSTADFEANELRKEQQKRQKRKERHRRWGRHQGSIHDARNARQVEVTLVGWRLMAGLMLWLGSSGWSCWALIVNWL